MKKLIFFTFFIIITHLTTYSQLNTDSIKVNSHSHIKHPILNSTELNSGFGLGKTDSEYSKSLIGITSILGYSITNKLLFGFGGGLLSYNGGLLSPFFIDLRFSLNDKKTSPFLMSDAGMLFDFSDKNTKSKLFLNPVVGIRCTLYSRLYAIFSTGLFFQRTINTEQHDTFINFRLGISYKFKQKV